MLIGINDHRAVFDAVERSDLAANKWKKFASKLGIEIFKVNQIASDNPHQSEECLSKILQCWLNGDSYDYEVCF